MGRLVQGWSIDKVRDRLAWDATFSVGSWSSLSLSLVVDLQKFHDPAR